MSKITTAMMSTTASTATAPMTAPAITSRIVDLYRSGQTQQAEDYAVWAWGNHFHITVNMFADMWEATHTAPAQNPAALIRSDEGTDGHQEPSAIDAIIFGFVEQQAKEHFGEDLAYWQGMAKLLSDMSEDARAKRFDKLLNTQTSIHDVWDLYEELYNTITPLFMTYLAPRAMSPDDFINACSGTRSVQMLRMTCPACGSSKFHHDNTLMPTATGNKLSVNLICDKCDFPLDVKVKF